MTPPQSTKTLTYIVNYLSADDAQHYVHIPNLLRALEELGWRINLVSERGGVGKSHVLGRPVTFLSRRSKTARLANLTRTLFRMRRHGGRLVFVRISKFAALASAILGRIFGWKTIFWLSGTVEDFNRRKGIKGRFTFAGMWILFRLVDQLATGPETMVDYYRRMYGLPERKVLLLYNDIEIDEGCPRGDPAPDGEMRVLIVHRLSPVRESDRYFPAILEALGNSFRKIHIPIMLDVCGDGPERKTLEAIAAKPPHGVTVRFHGAVPQRQLGEFYAAATLFAMPSYREGFPRVIIEAMARKLPIVTTDAGGTRDLLGPAQLAFVVDREDPGMFGKTLERLLSSSDDRRVLAQENFEMAQRFSTPKVARMYDRNLSRLIGAESSS
jgi:glycosyltransferase involved in cell wall biosynthesis